MIFVSSLAAYWYWQVGLSDAYCNGFSILSNCAIKVNLGCRNWRSPSCCQKNSGYEINSIFFLSLWQLWSAILWFIVFCIFSSIHFSKWREIEKDFSEGHFMYKNSCHIERICYWEKKPSHYPFHVMITLWRERDSMDRTRQNNIRMRRMPLEICGCVCVLPI